MRSILDLTGDKWSLLVVMLLQDEPLRFSALKRLADPISQRMLTRTLRQLEREGLVSRTIYPEVPPRVEYQLTQLGETLPQAITPLASWAKEHHPEIQASRSLYDLQRQATTSGKSPDFADA